MSYTTTPNLGLRVDTALSADSKYNLNRIDTLAATISLAIGGASKLRAATDIILEPDCSDSGVGGTATSGVGSVYIGHGATATIPIKAAAPSD